MLQSISHRDAWTTVLVLIFTRLLHLDDARVRTLVSCLFLVVSIYNIRFAIAFSQNINVLDQT